MVTELNNDTDVLNMVISAAIVNDKKRNDITVSTQGASKSITIPAKPDGKGSSVNGGELLFLALATCFCNDLYREAARKNMNIESVKVNVSGEFGKEGAPGHNIVYDVCVEAPEHSTDEIQALINAVDEVAEVHNTLRAGAKVVLQTRMD